MPSLCPPSAVSSIDPSAINALQELNPGDDSFLRDLIQIYLEDAPRRLEEIETALTQGDARQLAAAAHSLKGSSANFGAANLRSRCEKIEALGRSETLAPAEAELTGLREELARVRADLEALLSRP